VVKSIVAMNISGFQQFRWAPGSIPGERKSNRQFFCLFFLLKMFVGTSESEDASVAAAPNDYLHLLSRTRGNLLFSARLNASIKYIFILS